MVDTKKRILFVDDEQAILKGFQNLFYKERGRWELVFALGAEAGLSQLRTQAFDVVVSDMRMPGMDGADFLDKVRRETPATVRIMLSGDAAREAIVRALPSVHQLLSKPCDAGSLRAAIERGLVGGLADRDRDAQIRAVIGRIDKLPTPPAVYLELGNAMESAVSTTKDMAAIIERDPSLAAKLLQLVNSAYFNGGQTTSSIAAAVARLGMDRIRYIALHASVFASPDGDPFPGFSLQAEQERSLQIASRARELAAPADRDLAFAAGLLCDVGHVVLAVGLRDEYAPLVADGPVTVERELEVLGVTHADIGAALLGIWGLPKPIVDAVHYHHDPAGAPEASRALADLVRRAGLA